MNKQNALREMTSVQRWAFYLWNSIEGLNSTYQCLRSGGPLFQTCVLLGLRWGLVVVLRQVFTACWINGVACPLHMLLHHLPDRYNHRFTPLTSAVTSGLWFECPRPTKCDQNCLSIGLVRPLRHII